MTGVCLPLYQRCGLGYERGLLDLSYYAGHFIKAGFLALGPCLIMSFGLFLLGPPHLVDFPDLNTSTCFCHPALHRTRLSFGEYWRLSIFPLDLLWLYAVHFLLGESSLKELMLLSWNLTRPGTEDMEKRSSITKAVVSRRYLQYIEWINKKLLLCSTGTITGTISCDKP